MISRGPQKKELQMGSSTMRTPPFRPSFRTHGLRQVGRLREVVEVPECELELNGLVHLDDDFATLLLLINTLALAERDATAAYDVTRLRNLERDTLLGDLDFARVSHGLKVAADLLELLRRHGHDGRVVGLWDTELLIVTWCGWRDRKVVDKTGVVVVVVD